MRQATVNRGFISALFCVLAALPAAAEDQGPGWQTGPGFRLSRPGFELRLTGYLQGDFRSFHDYENANGDLPALASDSELRRFRLGFSSEWKRLGADFSYDLHDDTEHLKDCYLSLKISKGLHIWGGNMKVPVSPEWLTSAAKTDFIERSMIVDALAPGRDWGAELNGEPIKHLSYIVGVYAGDDRTAQARADTTFAGRLEATLAKGLDVGASYSQGQVHADAPDVADPLARGVPIHVPSGFRVYERHFVDGTRRRLGADLQFRHQSFALRGEVLQMSTERNGQGSVFDDLPSEVQRGWTASATWLVTGERKVRTIKPDHPIHHHGIGAVELGVRYDSIDVDDDGPDSGFEGAGSRARNIRPVGANTFTGGLSWWPVEFIRFMGNVVVERFDDPLLAPVPGKQGNYVTLLGRLQVSVP
jgi:phosphate-selective porin OprO and OprP